MVLNFDGSTSTLSRSTSIVILNCSSQLPDGYSPVYMFGRLTCWHQ